VLGGDGKLIETGVSQKSSRSRHRAHAAEEADSRRNRRHRRPHQGQPWPYLLRPPSTRRCRRSRSIPPTVVDVVHRQQSPLAGTEGDKVTSRMIREPPAGEAEGNVALRVTEAPTRISMKSRAARNCSSRS